VPPALASPDDLTGTLLVLCLPLDPDLPAGELATVSTRGDVLQPFLPARASGQVNQELRPWAWPQSRLVAYRSELRPQHAASAELGFGRSVATVEEQEPGDQPIFRRESSCASLWQVPGRGLVLVLEQLRPHVTAPNLDKLAAALREGHEVALLRELAGPLVPSRSERVGPNDALGSPPGAPPSPITLNDLLGPLPAALPGHRPLSELLVHRLFVTRGVRHIEGMFVALAAGAGRTVADLIERTLDEDDFEQVDRVQEDGNLWGWSSRELVSQPAQKGASIAVREDGRAAFIDLEAMSVYHDYLGVGGDTIVLEALPFVAERAAEVRDFWIAAETVDGLVEDDPEDLAKRLAAVRGVRARLERRAAFRDMWHSVERFTTWTHGGQLWSLLHSVSAEHEGRGQSTDERTKRAVTVADSMLRDIDRARREEMAVRAEERDEERRQEHAERTLFLQRVTLAMTAVAGLIGAIVLFTALAAIPQDGDRAIEPLLRVGFIATAVGVGLSALAYLGLIVAERRRLRKGRARWATCGAVAVGASVALTTVGGIVPHELGSVPLFVGWGLAAAGGAVVAASAPLTSRRLADRVPAA
jgi:hypothetical protein